MREFSSIPFYRFMIKGGKFDRVEYFYKHIVARKMNSPGQYELSFEFEILGGNYKDRGYDSDQEHLNTKVNETNEELFIEEIKEILNHLVSKKDARLLIQWIE